MNSSTAASSQKRVILAMGTRPEATKLAPVYSAFSTRSGIEPLVLLTGQHREQLEQALSLFDVPVAADLDLMTEKQTLAILASRILPTVSEVIEDLRADYVVVQGDTLTTFTVAWAAFLGGIPVGHVEAGLRSYDLAEPFPEEANRRMTSVLADIDLCPTQQSKSNLLREGKPEDRVFVTGQTGIDAVLQASQTGRFPGGLQPGPYVTVTLHRRENWPVLAEVAGAIATLAEQCSEWTFVFPVHMNPIVREAVVPVLREVNNVQLVPPLAYGEMAALLRESDLIITDSGGLQEEGAALGKPVVVVRNVTERPEGIAAGFLTLAGLDPEELIRSSVNLLRDSEARDALRHRPNPYGDGNASERVVQAVEWRLGLRPKPKDWDGGGA